MGDPIKALEAESHAVKANNLSDLLLDSPFAAADLDLGRPEDLPRHADFRAHVDVVFILWHSHEIDDDTEDKLIGVYKTREEAEAARARVEDKPGFKETPAGFAIEEYALGRDGWTESFLSPAEAMKNILK